MIDQEDSKELSEEDRVLKQYRELRGAALSLAARAKEALTRARLLGEPQHWDQPTKDTLGQCDDAIGAATLIRKRR